MESWDGQDRDGIRIPPRSVQEHLPCLPTFLSANSSDLLSLLRGNCLLEVLLVVTAVVGASPNLDLLGRQHPLWLHDRLLAMHPPRFDRVQPRALHRQSTDHDPHPA